MKRRGMLALVLMPVRLAARAEGETRVRGRLIQDGPRAPGIRLADRREITLEGDEPTIGVLRDARLAADDFEALGEYAAADRFRVTPIHEQGMFVYRGGKRLVITYWCDTCSIRTYTPGLCVCCQQETRLDPRDPEL